MGLREIAARCDIYLIAGAWINIAPRLGAIIRSTLRFLHRGSFCEVEAIFLAWFLVFRAILTVICRVPLPAVSTTLSFNRIGGLDALSRRRPCIVTIDWVG